MDSVDVTYRGLKLAEGVELVNGDFLPVEAPLPVGTLVTVTTRGGEPRPARVLAVVEQDEPSTSRPGMKLSFSVEAPLVEAQGEPDSAEPSDTDEGKASGRSEPGKKGKRAKKKGPGGA
jgi:hypothetical protein